MQSASGAWGRSPSARSVSQHTGLQVARGATCRETPGTPEAAAGWGWGSSLTGGASMATGSAEEFRSLPLANGSARDVAAGCV